MLPENLIPFIKIGGIFAVIIGFFQIIMGSILRNSDGRPVIFTGNFWILFISIIFIIIIISLIVLNMALDWIGFSII